MVPIVRENKMKKNNSMILEMEERVICNPDNPSEIVDWMGYEITEDNPISFIEIMGEDQQTEGVALLTKDSCKILQKVRSEEEDLYENWLASFSITDRRLADSNPEEFLWNMISELHDQTEIFAEEQNINKKR